MLLSNRTVLTNADLPKMMPLLQEFSSICKANDIPLNVWVGGNGYVMGTVVFTVGYESLADRFNSNAKLMASKDWWETNRKFREYTISIEPDTIMNFVRGGSMGSAIPAGTLINSSQFQMTQGADWLATLKYVNEYAELSTKVNGVDVSVVHTTHGVLGGVGMISGYPNAEALDAARAKSAASNELTAKFLEGGKFAMAGTVMQRTMIKVA
jgi:hypothetical protein